jgi:hypothetical protein
MAKPISMPCLHDEWTALLINNGKGTKFNKNWVDFSFGFGNENEGLWLSNKALSVMSKIKSFYLRVDLWNANGNFRFVELYLL